jgi:hypothetical protein
LTTSAPERALGSSLRATVTLREASPCPEVALNCIQGDSLDAVHAQSRAAVIDTATVPPFAVTVVGCAVTLVWHRAPSGPTMFSTAVEPPHEYAVSASPMTRQIRNG